jgi:hypothetical protein
VRRPVGLFDQRPHRQRQQHVMQSRSIWRSGQPLSCFSDDWRSSFPRMRERVFAKTREAVVDFQPRQLGAYALVESRTDSGAFIQAADGNGQQVSIAHIKTDAASTRRADHVLTKTLPGLCNQLAAEQSECGPRDMNEREHRCSGLLTAPVAVAITSIEHVSDLETDRIAGTPASQEKSPHGGLRRKIFDQAKLYRSLAGLVWSGSARGGRPPDRCGRRGRKLSLGAPRFDGPTFGGRTVAFRLEFMRVYFVSYTRISPFCPVGW